MPEDVETPGAADKNKNLPLFRSTKQRKRKTSKSSETKICRGKLPLKTHFIEKVEYRGRRRNQPRTGPGDPREQIHRHVDSHFEQGPPNRPPPLVCGWHPATGRSVPGPSPGNVHARGMPPAGPCPQLLPASHPDCGTTGGRPTIPARVF